MSDQPLFQHADEQEAAYAPDQLPEGSAAERTAEMDDRGQDGDRHAHAAGIPSAGAGLLGQMTGSVSGAVAGGTPGSIGPSVGSAAPEDETAGPDPDRD